MGALGDLLFNLTGQTDPRFRLASALAGGNSVGQGSNILPDASGQPVQLPGANPNTAPAPEPPQPQVPQAYQSAPDFSKMYLDLLNRQQASDAIDRGMGLLFAGFAQPNNRAEMVRAMSQPSGADSPGTIASNLGKIYQMQADVQMQRQMLANAPIYAKQLGIPVEQVLALIAQGKLPDILSEVEKNRLLLADPLHQAQTAAERATAAKTGAELAGTLPTDQMRELNALNAVRKSQNLPPLDILTYKMFSQPLDPATRAYYMAHPEMMPSGMTGVAPGSPAPGVTVGAGVPAPAANATVTAPAPVPAGSTTNAPALVPFEDARNSNFNDIPPVIPKLVAAPPIPGESLQQWQARQAQVSAVNDAAAKAAATDQQESITALKDGAIDDIGVRVQHLQSLLNSPLLPYAVGKFAGRLPSWVLPQNLEDFRAQLKQAQEAVYQTATTKLKGVTNRATQQEIGRVAEALGKLDATQQSPQAYKQAIGENLNDLASAALRTTQNAGVAAPDWLTGFKLTPPAPVTAVKPGLPDLLKPLSDADRAKAQDLIKRDGRDKVIQHLKANGYDTTGL